MSLSIKKKYIYFHIGYPKTATIFLQKNFFSKHNEINFFCRRFSKNKKNVFSLIDEMIILNDLEFESKKKFFRQQFNEINFDDKKINLISDQNILCHKFRAKNNMYTTLNRVESVFKREDIELNIFYSIREQEDAILSIYRQFYYSYFSKALPNINNIFDNHVNIEISEILESLKYYKVLKILQEKFGKNNVKVFSYETLKNDRIKYLSQICDYLKISKKLNETMKSIDYSNQFSAKKVSLLNSIKHNLNNMNLLIKYLPKKILGLAKFLIFEFIQGKIRLYRLSKLKFNLVNKEKIIKFYKDDNLKLINETKIKFNEK